MLFIAVIRWHEDDLIDSMKRAGLEPSEESIRKFMESSARKTLHERSVQEGWTILDDLVGLVLEEES